MTVWPAPFRIADPLAAETWIRSHVTPAGPMEPAHERPWATVHRVPLADGQAWFKVCGPIQAFEPRLTASLFSRWPDVVSEVLAYDEARSWLLLADAGIPISQLGNPPEMWMEVLPRYAELQRGEIPHADEHLERGVPDMRVSQLPARYEDLIQRDLPLQGEVVARLRSFGPHFAKLCLELEGSGIPSTIQHDDLHLTNVYARLGQLRVLDWGDASIAHPFASLGVTYRFLEEVNKLPPNDPWFTRLRNAYLEPWGSGLIEVFELAMHVGAFAHAIASLRQRDALPDEAVSTFDIHFAAVLRRAVAQTSG